MNAAERSSWNASCTKRLQSRAEELRNPMSSTVRSSVSAIPVPQPIFTSHSAASSISLWALAQSYNRPSGAGFVSESARSVLEARDQCADESTDGGASDGVSPQMTRLIAGRGTDHGLAPTRGLEKGIGPAGDPTHDRTKGGTDDLTSSRFAPRRVGVNAFPS